MSLIVRFKGFIELGISNLNYSLIYQSIVNLEKFVTQCNT